MQTKPTLSLVRIAAIALVLALAATAGHASKSSPLSGTPINLKVGQTFNVNVFGVAGCNFDYVVSFSTNGLVNVDSAAGTNVKSVKLLLTALSFGSTDMTVMTMAGTNPCPVAVHTFPITVVPDIPGLTKAFSKRAKSEISEFRLDAKLSYNTFKADMLSLGAQYTTDETLDADQFTSQVFTEFTSTMSSLWVRGWEASWDLSQFGTSLLAGNGVALGEGPDTIFAGSCGDFDNFNHSLNKELDKVFGNAKKQTKLSLGQVLKKDSMQILLTANIVDVYSKGPLYPDQTGIPNLTIPTTVMTILSRPTNNPGADNGYILSGGLADSTLGGTFEIQLTKTVTGQPDVVVSLTPAINPDHYWVANFPNLTPGHYRLRAGFQGDFGNTEKLVYVPKD